jgi:1,2-diacylglycerol 3-alpha-glucosyltransferase
MRIGMMADVYKPHVSGITNYIELNKRYLEQAGHKVYIFTFGDLDYQDEEENVLRSPGLPLVDTGYYLSFRYTQKMRAELKTMDVVHVHHPFLSGRLALRYCRPLRIPIVFTNHTRYDLYAQAYLPLLPDEVSETLLEAYLPPFCQAVDLAISPSAGMSAVLRELGVESPIEIVPNGVELERFRQVEPLPRAEFGYNAEDILLIYVGRLGPEKNLEFLIRAFSGVAGALYNVNLLIVGDGPAKEALEQLAAQVGCPHCIHFTGMIDYEHLPSYLAMCDAFVTASVTEVHPLSVIEAMAAGLPVVGIYSPGVGDTVVDGESGYLATEDLPAFTAKLTRLCLQDDVRQKMGMAARQASEKYAIERTTQIMLSHYEHLVYQHQPRQLDWRARLRGLLGDRRE